VAAVCAVTRLRTILGRVAWPHVLAWSAISVCMMHDDPRGAALAVAAFVALGIVGAMAP
jgi:hypothetical protein